MVAIGRGDMVSTRHDRDTCVALSAGKQLFRKMADAPAHRIGFDAHERECDERVVVESKRRGILVWGRADLRGIGVRDDLFCFGQKEHPRIIAGLFKLQPGIETRSLTFEKIKATIIKKISFVRREMDVGFVWDEKKYQQVIKDHGVWFYEVVSAFDDANGYEMPDPDLMLKEDRWVWIGRTKWDRILVIVYTEQDLPLYRIITAFEAEGKWIHGYYQRSK